MSATHSKSFEIKAKKGNIQRNIKSFDFIHYYKPAAENNLLQSEKQIFGNLDGSLKAKSNKNKSKNESIDISKINIDESNLVQSSDTKVTSTPKISATKSSKKIKSVVKSSSDGDENDDTPKDINKPKKRNKSVSFVLDENEEVIIKKTKSEDLVVQNEEKNKKKFKKHKFKIQKEAEKENEVQIYVAKSESLKKAKKAIEKREYGKSLEPLGLTEDVNEEEMTEKKNRKRPKKSKSRDHIDPKKPGTNEQMTEQQVKKAKKKKLHSKSNPEMMAKSEPAKKSHKDNVKQDIETDLENLCIGDNAHTLTGMLDEMTVVDRNKNNKHKKKKEQHKRMSNEISESEKKSEDEKEKVKWSKRKWNKDNKGILDEDRLSKSVVVENLPLSIMMNYRKLMNDHFSKYGVVQQIGVAELYPTEDPKPVFSTTVCFENEEAATKSLEEDNAEFSGSRISVKRPLAPALTTAVVRSYGSLADQPLCDAFGRAGRIRHIRHIVKGKKSMSTAFIKFDCPEAVERALRLADDVKIGGKKIYVSRFEARKRIQHKKIKQTESETREASETSD